MYIQTCIYKHVYACLTDIDVRTDVRTWCTDVRTRCTDVRTWRTNMYMYGTSLIRENVASKLACIAVTTFHFLTYIDVLYTITIRLKKTEVLHIYI